MRDLIRPILVVMARAGLFLSIAAWLVGQHLGMGICIGHFAIGFDQNIRTISWDSRLSMWRTDTYLRDEDPTFEKGNALWFRRLHRFPGVAARFRWPIPWVLVKHWLSVTLFMALNVVLQLSARRLPKT